MIIFLYIALKHHSMNLIILTFSIVITQVLLSQPAGDTIDVRDTGTEDILENVTQDAEDSELLERLIKLRENPIELNSATQDDLAQIPYIDEVVILKILQYRKRIGSFHSISQLKNVYEIDDELYGKISPFIYVRNSKDDYIINDFGELKKTRQEFKGSFSNTLRLNLRSRLSNDLQPALGYLNGRYHGTKPKIYNRIDVLYSVSTLKFSGGLLAEKDPGEKSFFDHAGGFIEIKSPFVLSQALLGDYTLEFGQGITLWGSYAFSKGIESVRGIKRKATGINSYASVNEVQFFRGGALRFNYEIFSGKLSLFGFYSNNYINASIDTITDQFSTLYTDGYHRTDSEIKRKNSGKEIFYGGRVQYELHKYLHSKLGVTYYRSKFSKPFKYKGLYEFSGDRSNLLGLDYDISYENINLFGEWTRSHTSKVGGINGIRISFFRIADLLFLVRNYPADFISLHSHGFGERSGNTQNESGIYSGLRFRIPRLVTVNIYFDQYKFPYRTFFIPMPVRGNDFVLYSEWKVARNLKAYTKYKSEIKEDVTRVVDQHGFELYKIYKRHQSNYRLQINYEISAMFRLRGRIEYVFIDKHAVLPSEKGILMFSDFRVKLLKNFILDGRFIVFQTDSYDSRLYEYENEINGVVTNQGLYGKGRRWYILLKYKPFSFLEFSAKYSETLFEGARSIGSGNDEIIGDLRNRLALQVELKF